MQLTSTGVGCYILTSNVSYTQSMADAFGRLKGSYYKAHPPAVRFLLALTDDGSLKFTHAVCTDHELVHRELLALLKELKLVPANIESLPLAGSSRGKRKQRMDDIPQATAKAV